MNNIKISKWVGRFGNNLEQIASCILLSKCIDGMTKIDIPIHNNYSKFLNTNTKFLFSKEYDYSVKKFDLIDWTTNCYYTPALRYVDEEYKSLIVDKFLDIFRLHIKPLLLTDSKKNNFSKDTISIHLRGGDIINSNSLLYQQRNLKWDFCKNILENNNYTKLIVCRDDDSNPLYEKIIDYCKYEGIELDNVKRSMAEDFCILMNSTNILSTGFSTFSFTSAYMNENLNNFYYALIPSNNQAHKEKIRLKVLEKGQCNLKILNNFYN